MNDNVEINLSTLIKVSISKWKIFIIILIFVTSSVFSFNYFQKTSYNSKLILKSPTNFYAADYLKTSRILSLLNDYITKVIEFQISDDKMKFQNESNFGDIENTDLFDIYIENFLSLTSFNLVLDNINVSLKDDRFLKINKLTSTKGYAEISIDANSKSDLRKAVENLNIISLENTKQTLVEIFESRLAYQNYLMDSILTAKILDENSDQFKYSEFFRTSAKQLIMNIKESEFKTNYIYSEFITKKSNKFSKEIASIFAFMITLIVYTMFIIIQVARNQDEKIDE